MIGGTNPRALRTLGGEIYMKVPHFRAGMVVLAAILLTACDVENRATGPTRDEPN